MQSTEQSLAVHQKLRAQVQRRVDLGAQSDADLQLAQTRLDSVKADLSATRARVESYHSQYLGSDANEIITVDVTSAATYNVVAMGGDDIIRVLSDGVSYSVVNIYGGTGKNTYVIAMQGTWSKLPGTIHIWDFDPTKDSIVFMSADGSRTADPRIKETKRTLFSSTADNLYSVSGGSTRI